MPNPCHNEDVSALHNKQYSIKFKRKKIMNSKTIRFFQALLLALFFVAGLVGPAHAQSAPASLEKVRLVMQSGWTGGGRHSAADDFVLVCPIQEVLDPSHPCSETNVKFDPAILDSLALVCPNKEVLDPSHPCANRRSQIIRATPDRFVLVCPIQEVLDPSHPCAQSNAGIAKFKIPSDFVMTCPAREVLEPGHPCANRSH
jgi:hypothetical protein